jgi:hypothetical protein
MFSAVPSDVRKGCAFPAQAHSFVRLRLEREESEAQPHKKGDLEGRAKPFRTSDGTAAEIHEPFGSRLRRAAIVENYD